MIAYSMRSSLLITIVVMGFMTIGFALLTGEIYLQQTLDNRSDTFTQVVELEVHNLWDELREETNSLGLSVQSSPAFRKALEEKKTGKMATVLNQHFHRAFVTLGILNLKKIIVYDKQLNKVAQSSEGDEINSDVCAGIIQKARLRSGADRFKTLHHVCNYKKELRLVTLVPVGGLRLSGYLAVVVDPLNNLTKSEQGLGIPVMIKNASGELLFQSESWPAEKNLKNIMQVHYANRAGNPEPSAHFYFATDVSKLNLQLLKTRIGLISLVVIATLMAIIVALVLFRQTIIQPLDSIRTYLHNIRSDKKHLDKDLMVTGSKELVDLANELNSISSELSRLYNEFEEMAFTDSLTGIPNRALLFDRLQQMTMMAGRDKSNNEFMLLMMDLNKFKAVNDELGHHVGDELLIAVAKRLNQALRGSDTVARLGGDEFAIILYAVNDKEMAISTAGKITALMNELFEIDGYKIEVGMSIGIARYPHDGVNSEQILHSADMAMYHAKRNKLPYVFYQDLTE